jgi:hypothetical protein
MTLEQWIQQATRALADEPAARIRAEVTEHYQSAREDVAAEPPIASLGDPDVANRQYKRVHLTRGEAKLLRLGACEGRFLAGSPARRWALHFSPWRWPPPRGLYGVA